MAKKNKDTLSDDVKHTPRNRSEIEDEIRSSRHIGFGSRENRRDGGSSKIGRTASSTENVLASSADISSAPDSTATGEDTSPRESSAPGRAASIEIEIGENHNAAEPDEEEVYSSESDELELARAVLEEATQSPGVKHDPSSAREEIEETDDFDRP